jgi:nitrate reductase gamma subunit
MANYINESWFSPFCMVVYFLGSWARFDRSQYTWLAIKSVSSPAAIDVGSVLFHVGIRFSLVTFGPLRREVYTALVTVKGKQLAGLAVYLRSSALRRMTPWIYRRLFDRRIRRTSKKTDIFILPSIRS